MRKIIVLVLSLLACVVWGEESIIVDHYNIYPNGDIIIKFIFKTNDYSYIVDGCTDNFNNFHSIYNNKLLILLNLYGNFYSKFPYESNIWPVVLRKIYNNHILVARLNINSVLQNCKEVTNMSAFYLKFCFTVFHISNTETEQYFLSGQENVKTIELSTNKLYISMRDGSWIAEIITK